MDLVLTVSVHLPVLLNNVHQQLLLGFFYNIPWAKWMNPNELSFFFHTKGVSLHSILDEEATFFLCLCEFFICAGGHFLVE